MYENTDQKEGTRLGDKWEWETSVVVEKNGIVSTIDWNLQRGWKWFSHVPNLHSGVPMHLWPSKIPIWHTDLFHWHGYGTSGLDICWAYSRPANHEPITRSANFPHNHDILAWQTVHLFFDITEMSKVYQWGLGDWMSSLLEKDLPGGKSEGNWRSIHTSTSKNLEIPISTQFYRKRKTNQACCREHLG